MTFPRRAAVATMRALVLRSPGCIALEKRVVPEPGPGEVLVKVRAATTCGTDLKAFLRGHPQIPMPGVFGHEYSGDVVGVGEGAPFSVGQAIMGVHSAPCGECRWCERAQENLCELIMATKVLGAYAEYLLIPAHIAVKNLFVKPPEVSYERAALLEPLACVAQGLSLVHLRAHDRVLVIGPGAIGLMFVAALRAEGVRDVSLSGRNPSRMAVGESLGAKGLRPEDLDSFREQFDVVIECTGRVEVWEKSLESVARGGQLVLFGGCPNGTKAAFDTNRVHYDQITLVSPFHFGTAAVRRARSWVLDPLIELDRLLSGDRALEDADAVFADLQRGVGIKYVLRP